MNKSRILVITLLATGLAALPALARNGNGGGNGHGNRGARQQSSYGNGTGICDGSGPGQGTPLRDGSGKALNNRGNPNSTGTPLKDGSGKATAPGKGPKDGTGANANCPNAN